MRTNRHFVALLAALLEAGNLINTAAGPLHATPAVAFRLDPALRWSGGGSRGSSGALVAVAGRLLVAAEPSFSGMSAEMSALGKATRADHLAALARDVRDLKDGLERIQEFRKQLAPERLALLREGVHSADRALQSARAAAVSAAGFLVGRADGLGGPAADFSDREVTAAVEVLSAAWEPISRASAAAAASAHSQERRLRARDGDPARFRNVIDNGSDANVLAEPTSRPKLAGTTTSPRQAIAMSEGICAMR